MYVVTLARKPLDQPTIVANMLEHGTGGLHIDAGRIAGIDPANAKRIGRDYTTTDTYFGDKVGQKTHAVVGGNLKGRWPANLALVHRSGCERAAAPSSDGAEAWACVGGCPVADLDEQSGGRNSSKEAGAYGTYAGTEPPRVSGRNNGGASRFFRQVKP